jgi:homoserine dehydrogenase
MKEVRIWIVGLGTVGQWLLRAGAAAGWPVRLRSQGRGRRQRAVEAAASEGTRIKELVTLELVERGLTARVKPAHLADEDPLARVSGVVNAVVCRAEPVGEVTVTGPGAGPEHAGQGVFSDLIAVARWSRPRARR